MSVTIGQKSYFPRHRKKAYIKYRWKIVVNTRTVSIKILPVKMKKIFPTGLLRCSDHVSSNGLTGFYCMIRHYEKKNLRFPLCVNSDIEWMETYPQIFKNMLSLIASCDEKAEISVNRILGDSYPNQKLIKNEIETLTGKIKEGSDPKGILKLRLDKLHMIDFEKQPVISERKINNLIEKLNKTFIGKALNRWNEFIDARYKELVTNEYNLGEYPFWLEKKEMPDVFLSVMKLPSAFKRLMHEIISKRSTAFPWDFREEEANRQFIGKLKSKNIDMIPWIDGNDRMIKKLPDGEIITVNIERDPMEVFGMGHYFETCLSPGGINFFSVISNIVDINKQVVYARSSNGKVQSRALLAITNHGGILTFHPYNNNPSYDFNGTLKKFEHSLAKKMNTIVVSTGFVDKLIAPDWYNDGPVDLTEKFPFTHEKSDFRQNLLNYKQEELIDRMKAVTAPVGLNELTLPLFINLPELDECSNLVDTIFPLVAKSDSLPLETFDKYARVLYDTGKYSLLEKLLPKIKTQVIKKYESPYLFGDRMMDIIISLSPVEALDILKKTRCKGIRSWNEDDGDRLIVAGKIYKTLKRPTKAVEMFSLAYDKIYSKDLKKYCLDNINELKSK